MLNPFQKYEPVKGIYTRIFSILSTILPRSILVLLPGFPLPLSGIPFVIPNKLWLFKNQEWAGLPISFLTIYIPKKKRSISY